MSKKIVAKQVLADDGAVLTRNSPLLACCYLLLQYVYMDVTKITTCCETISLLPPSARATFVDRVWYIDEHNGASTGRTALLSTVNVPANEPQMAMRHGTLVGYIYQCMLHKYSGGYVTAEIASLGLGWYGLKNVLLLGRSFSEKTEVCKGMIQNFMGVNYKGAFINMLSMLVTPCARHSLLLPTLVNACGLG